MACFKGTAILHAHNMMVHAKLTLCCVGTNNGYKTTLTRLGCEFSPSFILHTLSPKSSSRSLLHSYHLLYTHTTVLLSPPHHESPCTNCSPPGDPRRCTSLHKVLLSPRSLLCHQYTFTPRSPLQGTDVQKQPVKQSILPHKGKGSTSNTYNKVTASFFPHRLQPPSPNHHKRAG